MKHAVISLREELRALCESLSRANAGSPEARALAPQLRREIAEVREALEWLELAEAEPVKRPHDTMDRSWDRALFEPWAARKARRASERRVA